MTDWRALCEELAHEVEQYAEDRGDLMPECAERARAALAAEADGPAVPESREPASVVGEPSDVGLLELMPQQFREDLATVSRMAAHGAGTGVTPGLFRVSLNTGALDYARAVLARYGHPAPAPAGEVTAPHIRRMCDIILGDTLGNDELDSLALFVGHHPDVLNADLAIPAGEVE